MQVRKYYPTIYEDVLEMQAIGETEENEFDNNLKKDIKQAFNNNYVITCNTQGIEKYEKIFSIIPDEEEEDLEFRKERILNRLISQIPFTEEYLVQRLNAIIGEGQWYYEIDYNNYTLDVYITTPGRSWLNEINIFCSNIIPCNIVWTINIYAASWGMVNNHFTSWQDMANTCETWQDVMDGTWIL